MASDPCFCVFQLGESGFECAECAVVYAVIRGCAGDIAGQGWANIVAEFMPDDEFDDEGGYPVVVEYGVYAYQAAFFIH